MRSSTSKHPPAAKPPGITLFEVVLSLAIMLGAMTAIGQLISNGTRGAMEARLGAQAVIRCESKLSDILSGVEPLTGTVDAPFADDPDGNWVWSLEVMPSANPDLLILTVTTRHLTDKEADAAVTLTRMIRDPEVMNAQAAAVAPPTTTSSSSSSSSE